MILIFCVFLVFICRKKKCNHFWADKVQEEKAKFTADLQSVFLLFVFELWIPLFFSEFCKVEKNRKID